MTRTRDDARPRAAAPADEGIIAAIDTLAALPAEGPQPATGWWRRREVSRHFEERLREVGRRVVLGPSAAVLLDPGLRAEASELRRLWRELHPQAEPAGTLVTAQELAAAVAELRRRFEGVERLLRLPRTEALAAAGATHSRTRSFGSRAARR